MIKNYTTEQFWKLYGKLPQELKDALFAEETGDNIYETCKRNGVEKHLATIVKYVGQVLIGVLPPEEFQKALEEELKLKNEAAKKVSREINRFIFYPVKPALEELYKIEINPIAKTNGVTPLVEEKTTAPASNDTYRETIE